LFNKRTLDLKFTAVALEALTSASFKMKQPLN